MQQVPEVLVVLDRGVPSVLRVVKVVRVVGLPGVVAVGWQADGVLEGLRRQGVPSGSHVHPPSSSSGPPLLLSPSSLLSLCLEGK